MFDTIAENAVRICQGQFSFVVRFDNELLRFGACHGLTPEGLEAFQRVLMLRTASPEDRDFARRMIAICLAKNHDYQTVEFTATVKPGQKVDLLYELVTHQARNAKQNNVTVEKAEVER